GRLRRRWFVVVQSGLRFDEPIDVADKPIHIRVKTRSGADAHELELTKMGHARRKLLRKGCRYVVEQERKNGNAVLQRKLDLDACEVVLLLNQRRPPRSDDGDDDCARADGAFDKAAKVDTGLEWRTIPIDGALAEALAKTVANAVNDGRAVE